MKYKMVFVVLIVLSILLSGCIKTGKGTSKDTIYGIEQNYLGSYSLYLTNDHPTDTYSAIYTFDNENTELIEKLKRAEESGRKVKIYYHNELIIWPPTRYNSAAVAIIDDVEEISP